MKQVRRTGLALLVASLGGCGGQTPAPSNAPAAAVAPTAPAPDVADLPAPYNAADLTQGRSLFAKKCASCHFIDAAKGNMVGPNLHGVFERGVAVKTDYAYSAAIRALPEKAWTPELIDQWLASPQAMVPGSAMNFNGVSDPNQRRDLIGFLLIESRK